MRGHRFAGVIYFQGGLIKTGASRPLSARHGVEIARSTCRVLGRDTFLKMDDDKIAHYVSSPFTCFGGSTFNKGEAQ